MDLFVRWLGQAGSRLVGAALGTAAVTAVVSAVVRHYQTLSWEAMWVLWTVTPFVTFVLAFVAMQKWWPQEWRHADSGDQDVAAQADRRRTLAEAGTFMRSLFQSAGRDAINDVFRVSSETVFALRPEPSDAVKYLASNLIYDLQLHLHDSLRSLRAEEQCDSDEQIDRYLRAWGDTFQRYQTLVCATDGAFRALGGSPWEIHDYRVWRAFDADLIKGLKQVEHLQGAGELVSKLRAAGWGDDNRQPEPTTKP